MENLSVRTKILLLSAIMLIITCVVAAVGIYSNHKSKQSLDDMYNYNLMTTQYLNDANNHLRGIDVDVAYLLQQDFSLDSRKVELADISGRLESIKGILKRSRKSTEAPGRRKPSPAWKRTWWTVAAKVKACESLGNTPEDKVKLFENLSASQCHCHGFGGADAG